MDLVLRNSKIVYPGHRLNGKRLDIHIKNGKIVEIGKTLKPGSKFQEIKSKNLQVSPGWMDLRANFCEPGYEEKETIETGRKAAAAGGFTAVCLTPNTHPATDSRAGIEFFVNKNGKHPVDLFPIGALSNQMKGDDLSEMYDMKLAGAVAFSNYKSGIENAKFMQLALEYSKGIEARVIAHPNDENISGSAEVNEGENSTRLGLKGIPHLAEELRVNRDIYLSRYTNGILHFSGLSSTKSADLIRNAKKDGLDITCDVSAAQLVLNDDCLEEFDSNYKVKPPIRLESDRKGLLAHVLKGNVDVICSDHEPQNIENKACEFQNASYGMIGIQTVYPLLNSKLKGKIPAEVLVEKLAINPRKVLGMDQVELEEGSNANLTFFDPDIKWEYSIKNNLSKSKNSPFIGETFTGKVLGVTNNGKAILAD
ncbi:MAG: dihydroorotase [Crocinitomicaceae bacterium]|nr:dihydroorotase [Crocinitomicaceae bacterium]|tara:strand:- start:125 stop:1396 length:1272 start_codon:yes stop_codon:yes gene_type:complete